MTIKYRDTIRDAKLNAIETTGGNNCSMSIFTGSPPTNVTDANTGTLLLDFNLPDDWMALASGGAMAKAGTWSGTASGGSSSTPGYFRIYNSRTTKNETTCIIQGSCGVGSGDINFDGVITAGQTVTINSFTLNDNN